MVCCRHLRPLTAALAADPCGTVWSGCGRLHGFSLWAGRGARLLAKPAVIAYPDCPGHAGRFGISWSALLDICRPRRFERVIYDCIAARDCGACRAGAD